MPSGNGHDPDVDAVRFALQRARALGRSHHYGGLAAFVTWTEDGLDALDRLETRLTPTQLQTPMVCKLPGPEEAPGACLH